jgi:hypothetical protein
MMQAMRIILFAFVFFSGCAAADAAAQDGPAILEASRAAYQKLSGYHFAHDLEIAEAGAGGKQVKSRLSFVTATADATGGSENKIGPRLNLSRCRLEMRDDRGTIVVACDDDVCLLYQSRTKEFSRGRSYRDHFSSVGGSIFLGYSGFVYTPLVEGAVADAKLVGEAEIEVGREKRKCYVVEGTMPATPIDSDKPQATLNLDWLLSMLALHDLGEGKTPQMYSPRPRGERPTKPAEPTRVTLWIDQTSHLVCRSRLSAPYFTAPADERTGQAKDGPVQVTATFTFTVVEGTAPPKDLFRFTPPPDAKEVPNMRERARKTP